MKKLLTLFVISCLSVNAFAQVTIKNVDLDNGKALLEAYLSPFGESLGAGLNNGWWNTAKPHSLGGFDVTLTVNTVLIPDGRQSFNVNDVGGSSFTSTSSSTPTFIGGGDGANVIYKNASVNNPNFDMPSGSDISVVPLPMLQAGIGLIKNTEINIRYIPKQNIGSIASIKLLGFGLKHDVLQWIPVAEKLPIDVSIQGGYTNLNTIVNIEAEGEKQEVNLDVKATTINLLASKKIAMLTCYIGLGYNSSTTTLSVDGKYSIGSGPNAIIFNTATLSNLKFESQNNLRANIGFRFQIAVLAIQANYTFSKYPVATVGLGISIR